MLLPYTRLGAVVAKEGLEGLGIEGLGDAKKVFNFLRGKQRMSDVGELRPEQVSRVWKGLVGKDWKGEHEELAWRAVRNALPVRQVLYRWGLSRSPKCPRELCDEPESVTHVLWDCSYAQRDCLKTLTWVLGEDEGQKLVKEGMMEIKMTFLSFWNSKTPGADGLPKELYVAFWDQVVPDLLEVSRECLQKDDLGVGMEEGVIMEHAN
ncbi:hypothetical protein Y1Q_0004133 [Alligator mississippiensis]|uniref:Reverse transcriptase zinc-binding domain-containing protein n=1 Tax=Alligator mississippiensis TaxID=8496 RepID=A0A151PI82_ALLMI|nr:hypothetical protein Y1Q_0004133 [Alligator mississippiensis]